MAINLVRKPSEIPNINNYDDYRMFRYATGGYNGVIEKYGNECDYEINGNTFKIKSGEIVIDGVQSKIDASGVGITVDNVTGTEYYTVYCEVNLSLIDNQKSEIKATKSTVNYPVIEKGDDLTENTSGVAKLPLYTLDVTNGVISNVVKKFNLINFLEEILTGFVEKSDFSNANSQTKFNNLIVEKKLPLISTKYSATTHDIYVTIPLSENINVGDVIELWVGSTIFGNLKVVRFLINNLNMENHIFIDWLFDPISSKLGMIYIPVTIDKYNITLHAASIQYVGEEYPTLFYIDSKIDNIFKIV